MDENNSGISYLEQKINLNEKEPTQILKCDFSNFKIVNTFLNTISSVLMSVHFFSLLDYCAFFQV